MTLILVVTLLFRFAVANINSNSFSNYYLCHNIVDPNVCVQTEFSMLRLCENNCCKIHDNTCDLLLPSTNERYNVDECMYETTDYLYDLYSLQLNPYTTSSYYFPYKSVYRSHNSPFYHEWLSLYINICNKTSVLSSIWNHPPDTSSLNSYLTKSAVICSKYGSNHNQSALCTELGHVAYNTSHISVDAQNINQLTINLGAAQCLYYESQYIVVSKDIYVNLVIECDVNTHEAEVISVSGPIFTLDQLAQNHKCSNNVTIKMKTNSGACARSKIYANKSHIICPTTFNKTAQTINCTLYSRSNYNILTGSMTDIKDNYLAIYAVFATKTQNISLDNFDIDIKYNATGIFNITLNVTHIYVTKLKEIKQEKWNNIFIRATCNYAIGPNTTTKNVSIQFKQNHATKSVSSTTGKVLGWLVMFVFMFSMIYMLYRLRNKETRNFFCIYCMRCHCFKHGCNACIIGGYILCCDNPKQRRFNIDNSNKALKLQDVSVENDGFNHKQSECISFWGFVKDTDDATHDKYDSMSDFLYRQESGYAEHFGLRTQKQKKKSKKQNKNSISLTSDEDYVL